MSLTSLGYVLFLIACVVVFWRFQQEIEYMRTRHIGILRGGDPCYNKNLSVTHWNYSLREGAKMT